MQDASFHLAADDGGQDFRAEGALSTSAPSAHAPGPWGLHAPEGADASFWSVWSDGGRFICGFERMVDEAKAEQVANIRLITAAPELLEALLLAESEIKHLSATVGLDRSAEKALTTCAAAIRKATGEQA